MKGWATKWKVEITFENNYGVRMRKIIDLVAPNYGTAREIALIHRDYVYSGIRPQIERILRVVKD